MHREFAPTAGSGISEPKPTDRAKVNNYESLFVFNFFSGASRHWKPDVNLSL